MAGLVETLRDGSWLTRARIRLVTLALLAASSLALIVLVATSDGLNDYQNRPLGTDFSNIYAAGTYVRDGEPAAPFDLKLQAKREQAIFGPDTPIYGWHYPPFFLFIAGALAFMPYAFALFVWQGATLALFLAAMRAVLRAGGAGAADAADRLWPLAALAFPAVFINIGHGHNGFLTAALMGFGLVWLQGRPIAAGVMFGLLAYKPQFGVMIPLVLIASGCWRAFVSAAITVGLLALASTMAFGPEIWRAFLASTAFTREVVLEQGNTGWHKIQSIFSWVRMWGGSVPLAYAVHAAAVAALAITMAWLWRRRAAYPLQAAGLCLAAILATPYSLDYDLMLLAPAIAFLAAHGRAHGFAPFEASALALLWLMPVAARSIAELALVPLGAASMLLVLGMTLRKAMGEHSRAPRLAASAPA